MRTTGEGGKYASPMRLLKMLSDRVGAFQTIAYASLHMATTGEHENAPPMSWRTANAIVEFGDDLRQAYEAVVSWAERRDRESH